MELFTIENLNFSFGGQEKNTLTNINFTVNRGDFLVLIGESGSGKSTLLKMLKRELTPHGEKTGTIIYKGQSIDTIDAKVSAREIGYVMQKPDDQIILDTVWHELAFGLENIGTPQAVIRRRIGEIAYFFGIQHWYQKKTKELSGGQKQLLNVAAVLVMQPKVLILDEPTSQLDPIAASEFLAMLHKLNRDLGLTIIMAEHRLEDVFPIANKVLLMEKGEIIVKQSPRLIGQQLNTLHTNHKMLVALPSAVRIFNGLNGKGESPLTVSEGITFLNNHCHNRKAAELHVSNHQKASQEQPILELKNIWFRYKKNSTDILKGVELTIKKGEIVGIVGGNGSGKTTLLHTLAAQNKPYRGNLYLNGQAYKKLKAKELFKHNLAMLPQDPLALFIKSTVREDFLDISRIMGYTKQEIEKQITDVCELLSIKNLLEVHPRNLSGGEQQKVAIGKILLLNPKILLLDEPTKGLDAFSKVELSTILYNLKMQGVTIVVVTHDLEFAATVSDRCGLFFDGEVSALEHPTNFFASNHFYTTMANRISRHIYSNAITCEDVITLGNMNGMKE